MCNRNFGSAFLLFGSWRIIKISVLIKGGKYIEALAKADAFVFDKTGTLTTGELSVNKVFAYGNHTSSEIIALAAACERYSSHPIAMAIKIRQKRKLT